MSGRGGVEDLGGGGGVLRGSAIDLGLTPHQRVSAQGATGVTTIVDQLADIHF